jgi:dCMP deaminase
MKTKLKEAYMKTAETFAELSHARRLHVGAIIVKDDRIISIGYNGMPAGWDNNCEDKVYPSYHAGDFEQHPDEFEAQFPFVEEEQGPYYEYNKRYQLKTKPEVLHAESNAIAKLARSSESGLDASLFVTHAPCMDCAKLIYQSGISSVYYRNSYRDVAGIEFLKASSIKVEQI